MSAPRVLVVGDVMLDRYWHGDVTRISPEAPVPVVKVTRVEDRLGGAANVAANVVALGGQCRLIGIVGTDADGRIVRKMLREEGIFAAMCESGITTVKTRVIGQRQQMLRMDSERAPDHTAGESVLIYVREYIDECDVVVLSDYNKGALGCAQQIIQAARKASKPVLVDPKGTDWTKYRGATLIKPNLSEVDAVVGPLESDSSGVDVLRRSLEVDSILVTMSDRGMTLYWEGEPIHQPAHAREVFDVTGAGDTVIAAMAVAHGLDQGWQADMRFASSAAGIVVGKVGTATATAAEVSACVN